MMSLSICEIFHSIQGESVWTGLPCVFIRLAGCNLRCRYCDTRYAYEPGDPMSIDDILTRVAGFKCPRVTITGGEPLLQDETPALVTRLIKAGYAVSMETNGSLPIDEIDRRCIRIVDLKCPSSMMQHHNHMGNIALMDSEDQIKFVIADRSDFDFAAAVAKRLSSDVNAERIWLSPVYGILSARRLTDWMIESNINARLQIQLHKILWPDTERGV